MVNCGAAMYAAPVGIVNACDPLRAYQEAIDVFSAHQSCFGLEAAGVMAACVAEALSRLPRSVRSSMWRSLSPKKVLDRLSSPLLIVPARSMIGVALSDHCAMSCVNIDTSPDDAKGNRGNESNNWTPSREHSIEKCRLLSDFLVVANGDFEQTIFGATNYGRDNDSIAGMGGAIAGALARSGCAADRMGGENQ